jgi:RHS repeat-associated protein
MYVYLSYEGDGSNWVYFDDLKITHTKSNVVQYNEYYPFGLQTSNSRTRENSNNNFLYNGGSELNQTTGWYETAFRGYDAALGSFMQIDPLATRYASYSGYHYSYNNPIMFNDPTGATTEEEEAKAKKYWEDMIARLMALEHGGRADADGNVHEYASDEEAFEAGVDYNNRHNSWGETEYRSEAATRAAYGSYKQSGHWASPVHYNVIVNFRKTNGSNVAIRSMRFAQQEPVINAEELIDDLLKMKIDDKMTGEEKNA